MPWTRGISDDPQKVGNAAAVRRYQANNREKIAATQKAYRERNIQSKKEYDSLRHKQKREARWAVRATHSRPDGCEICGSDKAEGKGRRPLVFDHCHTTGKFRGWLCGRCNRVLGSVKDDAQLLRKLADYLEVHSNSLDKKTS